MPKNILHRLSASSASVFAVLAGLAFLLSMGAAREQDRLRSLSLASRFDALESWSQYHSLRVQDSLLQSQRQTLIALDRPPAAALDQDIERNHKEQDDVSREARSHEESSRRTQDRSDRLSRRFGRFAAATGLFLVAVAVASLAARDGPRSPSGIAIAFGAAAAILLLDGLLLLF
jgi:hypothetical protein